MGKPIPSADPQILNNNQQLERQQQPVPSTSMPITSSVIQSEPKFISKTPLIGPSISALPSSDSTQQQQEKPKSQSN